MNRVPRWMLVAVILAVLFGAAMPSSYAQNAAGRIVGTVTDQTGATIQGANVTVTNLATQISQQTTTGGDGFYQLLNMPIGRYRVTIEKDGFQQQVFDGQTLQISQSLRLDAQLSIYQTKQAIEVKEQASDVETVNATVGGTVIGAAIQQAPLNGRNVLDLAKLQPGVTETNPDSGAAGTVSIAGGRTDSVTFLLDGGLNNNLLNNGVVFNPNPDTVEEFRVLESNYSAEYGRNAGGIISEVTKSGSNAWHGTAFDYLRNGDLDANTFFNKINGLPRDSLRRNQYGGTFGGPIRLPHLVNGKDRFFFFVGYQGQKLTNTSSPGAVPVFTPGEVAGNFSQDPNVVAFLQAHPFFAANNATEPGVINPAAFNSAAVNFIAHRLIPSSPTGRLAPQSAQANNQNELTMKFDFLITQSDKLTATIGGFRNPTLDPFAVPGSVANANVPGYSITNQTNAYFVNLAYTRTISPDVLNEVRFVTQRRNILQGQPASGFSLFTPGALGLAVTPDNPTGPPTLSFGNGLNTGFTNDGPSTLVDNTFGITEALSWVRGRHNFKFGGGFSGYQDNQVFDFITNGAFAFNGGTTGNGLADFLIGSPTFYQQSPAAPSNIRSKSTYGFFQDEWRATTRLTLSLGLRYEYSSPKYDTRGRTFSVVPGLQSTVFPNAPAGLVFPGDKGAPSGVNFPNTRDWAPRFGFAWDPRGNGKTSIRGGAGIFYDVLKAEDNFQFNGQAPYFSAAFISFPTSVPATQASPLTFLSDPFGSTGTPNTFPSTPPAHNISFANLLPFGAGSVFFVDPHLSTPYTYQYNLSVQQEFASSIVLEIAYLGSSSHGLTALEDVNPFVPGTTNRRLNLGAGDSTCPDETAGNSGLAGCTFAAVNEFKNATVANYNAMTVSLTKQMGDNRFLGKTYFTFGYTYSHGIDNVSGFRQRNSQVPSLNPGLFRASSDTDVRNRVTLSGGWDLPLDRAWNSGPKRLTQGWSLFPILTWRTGFPLDVNAQLPDGLNAGAEGTSGAGDGFLTHANLVGPVSTFNPKVTQTLNGQTGNFFFNPTSFSNAQCGDANNQGPCAPGPGILPSNAQVVANPKLATYGTVPRNFLRGPGLTNFDLSISKTTPLFSDRVKLELRGDFFNLFNHAEFANPDTNILSPTFGQILSTGTRLSDGSPRIVQIALRLNF